MEDIIELILDLILEGSIEISKNKKLPKWIRYPLIGLITLFFSFIIILIFTLGIMISNESALLGMFIIIISFIFFIMGVLKFKELYLVKKKKSKKNKKTKQEIKTINIENKEENKEVE